MSTALPSHPSVALSPFPLHYQLSIPTTHLFNSAPRIPPVSLSLAIPPLAPVPKSYVQITKEANVSLPSQPIHKLATQQHPEQRAQAKVRSLNAKRALEFQVCFRCGDTSHSS
jgi:hypothetical protein